MYINIIHTLLETDKAPKDKINDYKLFHAIAERQSSASNIFL